jgi:hypothetical protein
MPSLKSLRIVVGGLVVIGLSADSARASDTVAVATNVNSVTQVTTGGTAPTLTLATVNAGTNRFTDATDFTHATYSVFNDAVPVGSINIKGAFTGDTLPDGLELKVNLVAPTGATSSGTRTFVGASQDTEQVLVTGIDETNQGAGSQNKAIQFTLHASDSTAVAATGSTVNVTLTLTIIDE